MDRREERETDRQTDRQAETQKDRDRQTDRQTDRRSFGWIQTEIQTCACLYPPIMNNYIYIYMKQGKGKTATVDLITAVLMRSMQRTREEEHDKGRQA